MELLSLYQHSLQTAIEGRICVFEWSDCPTSVDALVRNEYRRISCVILATASLLQRVRVQGFAGSVEQAGVFNFRAVSWEMFPWEYQSLLCLLHVCCGKFRVPLLSVLFFSACKCVPCCRRPQRIEFAISGWSEIRAKKSLQNSRFGRMAKRLFSPEMIWDFMIGVKWPTDVFFRSHSAEPLLYSSLSAGIYADRGSHSWQIFDRKLKMSFRKLVIIYLSARM